MRSRLTLLASALIAFHAGHAVEPIRLGAVYSTTGPMAPLDVPALHGAQTLVGQVNRGGGIAGRKIELVVIPVDSTVSGTADAMANAIKKDNHISAFIGLSDSDLALAAAEALNGKGYAFVTSGATSPKLPSAIWRPRIFLSSFGDNVQAAAAAEWLRMDRKAATASVIYNPNSSYTRLLNTYFSQTFRHLGGRILRRITFQPGTITVIPPSVLKADAIYLAAHTADEAMPIIRTLRNMGFPGPIIGGDGFDIPYRWRGNPEARDVFYTTHAFPSVSPGAATKKDVAAFKAAFRKDWKGEEPGTFAALGRDAALLTLTAIAKGGDRPIDVVRALRAGAPFAGLTGQIAFPAGRQVPVKPVAIVAASKPDKPLLEIMPAWVPQWFLLP